MQIDFNKIQEIKDALAKSDSVNGNFFTDFASYYHNDNRALLIQNASEWIRYLLEINSQLLQQAGAYMAWQPNSWNNAQELERFRAALTTIATCDIPYAPMTEHSVMRFYEKTAKEALEGTDC